MDWEGKRYLGLTLDWDVGRKVHLSMSGYIPDALKRFKCKHPKRRQDSPHKHVPPNYDSKQQFVPTTPDATILGPTEKTYIQ